MEQFILAFKELGIAGIAVAALLYLSTILAKELAQARADYAAFVNANNHTTTELVKEAIATMTEVRESIKNHNDILKVMVEKIK